MSITVRMQGGNRIYSLKRRDTTDRFTFPDIVQCDNKPNNPRKKRKIQIDIYDAVLIAGDEDNPQRQLHIFNITAGKYNMKIKAEKTKYTVIRKEPRRYKLKIEGKGV